MQINQNNDERDNHVIFLS